MSTKEKLLERFKNLPMDFTFDELVTLLNRLGYKQDNKGSTSGSRAIFILEGVTPILLHKPHPGNVVHRYVIKRILRQLKEDGKIKEENEDS